jgi:hypothetical protein
MDRVKIYSYSNKLLTFVDAKWTIAKLAVVGVLIGSILFFGFIKLNQAVGITPGSRTAIGLAAENNVLRQEVTLISPRVSMLAVKTRVLSAQDDRLHLLLYHQEMVGDSVTGFTNPTKWVVLQSLNPSATNVSP